MKKLPELRRIGFAANGRLLLIVQVGSDCALSDDALRRLQRHRSIKGQRASALCFADANARAVLNAVLMFVFVARGFSNKDLRQFASGGQGYPQPPAPLCRGEGDLIAVEGKCRACRDQRAQDRRTRVGPGHDHRAGAVAGRHGRSDKQRLCGAKPRHRAGAWPPVQPQRHDTVDRRVGRGDCPKRRGDEDADHQAGGYGGPLRGRILAWNHGDMPVSARAQAVCMR